MAIKLGFVDTSASLLSVAWRCKQEGCDVLYLTLKKEEQKIGQGLVDRVSRLQEIIDERPDVVLCYNTPKEAMALRRAKLNVIGPNPMSTLIEEDRMYASRIVRDLEVGIAPRMERFKSAKDASKFIREEGTRKRWVFKAEGTKVDTNTTHVTEDMDHLLEVIDYEDTLNRAKGFVLQEYVAGVEISIEGWFDYRLDGGWVMPINSTLERKRLGAGDVGPMTGCMGSLVWAWPTDRPRLFRQTLENMTPWLKKAEYIGPIDGNFIIDFKEHRPHFIEFTPRVGWDAFEALMTGLPQVGEMLNQLGRGELEKMTLPSGFMGAVRLYTPLAPDSPINCPLDSDYRLYPKDIYKDEDDTLRCVGTEGIPSFAIILEATAIGPSIPRVMNEIYEDVIPQVIATDLFYRKDIGEQAQEDVELLEQWGYVVQKEKE